MTNRNSKKNNQKKHKKTTIQRKGNGNSVVNMKAAKKPQKVFAKKGSGITKTGKLLREAGGIAGNFLGSKFLGTETGAAISRIFGQGDYQVKSNSLVAGGPPSFAAMNSGIRMSHREYLADVLSTTSFGSTVYDINVINPQTFPWLSNIAQNFEEYSIKGIVFYFNSTCGSAVSSTNNALGTVGLVTVYDPTDSPLASKRECEDYNGCVAGMPSNSLLHPVECKAKSNVLDRLYIQSGALLDPEDKKFYSHGTLNVFTQGMQAAGVNIGELWVSYDIEFYNPKILPVGTFDLSASRNYFDITSGITNTLTLGAVNRTFLGNMGLTYDVNGYYHIPRGTAPGYYMFTYMGNHANSGIFPDASYTFNTTNISLLTNWVGGAASSYKNPLSTDTGTVQNWSITSIFKKTDALESVFRLATSGTVLAAWKVDIVCVKLPSSCLSDLVGTGPFAATRGMDELLEDKIRALLIKLSTTKHGFVAVEDLPPPLLVRGQVFQPGDLRSSMEEDFTSSSDDSSVIRQ